MSIFVNPMNTGLNVISHRLTYCATSLVSSSAGVVAIDFSVIASLFMEILQQMVMLDSIQTTAAY